VATPDFVLELREKIGTQRLWLGSVTAVVLRGTEVLLVKRADNGNWGPVTGIIDPGEEPAVAAERECLEEAAVVARCEGLAWIQVTGVVEYANGDSSQYLDHVFVCSYLSGEPFPADGENTEAAWFDRDALPEMPVDMRARIQSAIDFDGTTRFQR